MISPTMSNTQKKLSSTVKESAKLLEQAKRIQEAQNPNKIIPIELFQTF
jgi:hypothetical protein